MLFVRKFSIYHILRRGTWQGRHLAACKRLAFVFVLGTLLAAQSACTLLPDEQDDQTSGMLLALLGLSQVSLTFSPRVGAQTAACSSGGVANSYSLAGSSGTTIKDMRLYVSNVRLVSGGVETAVTLANDGANQYNGVALLDFEDASGDCIGTTATNTRIVGTVTPGAYSSVRFTVGVPQALNHTDASAGDTPAPLNVVGMYWSWTGGRKFARFEFKNGANSGLFHLGSTTCTGTPPSITCAKSNRPEVELAIGANGSVKLDLAELFGHTNWAVTANPTCHSAQAVCQDAFPKLGLNFSDGSASATSQSVFGAL